MIILLWQNERIQKDHKYGQKNSGRMCVNSGNWVTIVLINYDVVLVTTIWAKITHDEEKNWFNFSCSEAKK